MQKILKYNLQKNILKHVILTEQPDYKTISKELNKNRLTIRQSIISLSKTQCIVEERVNPNNEKSKIIFRPTIKGLVIGIGELDIKFEQIKNNSQKVIDIDIYQKFKNNLGVDKLNDFLKLYFIGLINFKLIDNNSNQILGDPYSINKMFLRFLLLDRLLNKDFDIDNLFLFPNEAFYKQNVKDVNPSEVIIPFKMVLVKIKDNLQKTIDLLPE